MDQIPRSQAASSVGRDINEAPAVITRPAFPRVASSADLRSGASHKAPSRDDLAASKVLNERRPRVGLGTLELRPSADKGERGLCKIQWPSRWTPSVEGRPRSLGAKLFARSHTSAQDNRRDIAAALAHLQRLELKSSASLSESMEAEGGGLGPQHQEWAAGAEGVPNPHQARDDTAGTDDVGGGDAETPATRETHQPHDTDAHAATDDLGTDETPCNGASAEGLDPTIPLTIGFALAERFGGTAAGIHGPAALEMLEAVIELATQSGVEGGKGGDSTVSLTNLRLLIGGLSSAWPYPVKEFVAHQWLATRVHHALKQEDIVVAQGLGLGAGYEGLVGLQRKAAKLAEGNRLPTSISQFVSHMEQAKPLSRDWLDLAARCAPRLLDLEDDPRGIGPMLESYLKLTRYSMGASHAPEPGTGDAEDLLKNLRSMGLMAPTPSRPQKRKGEGAPDPQNILDRQPHVEGRRNEAPPPPPASVNAAPQ